MASPPPVGHVFVINLENENYSYVWATDSKAPYLAKTLRRQGILLKRYFGVAHNSLPNYIAQISGQGANPSTQADCPVFLPWSGVGSGAGAGAGAGAGPGTGQPAGRNGQLAGTGCVYPATVPTVANQLTASGRTWKGYMEDMSRPCLHPELGAPDPWHTARPGDQYATRHNPFVYFRSITGSADCARRVVGLDRLPADMASAAGTPNLVYVTPNLCNDGHDDPCVDGRPGGLEASDSWLRRWVPRIMSSPAFRADGLLVITLDEARPGQRDSGANRPDRSELPGMATPDGGRVGALLISPFITPGTSSTVPYNHYSLLAGIEDIFSLPLLGYAADPRLNHFGQDIYTRRP